MASNLEEEIRSYIIVDGNLCGIDIRPGKVCRICLARNEPRIMYLKVHPYPVWLCYASHFEYQVLDLFRGRHENSN